MHATSDTTMTTRLGLRGRVGLVLLLACSAGASVGLGGCASSAPADTASLHASFGNATAHNTSAQSVAPTERQKADTYIPPNAARQRLAVETYEAGEVEVQPVTAD